jgi:hypothetical protein
MTLRIAAIVLSAALLACSNDDPAPSAAAPAQAPPATATVDPRVAAVAIDIEQDGRTAKYLVDAFAARDSELGEKSVAAMQSCLSATVRNASEGRAQDLLVLWPRAYEDLHTILVDACQSLAVRDATALLDPSTWLTLRVLYQVDLTAAIAALPDYSPAQLRRAIADRQ